MNVDKQLSADSFSIDTLKRAYAFGGYIWYLNAHGEWLKCRRETSQTINFCDNPSRYSLSDPVCQLILESETEPEVVATLHKLIDGGFLCTGSIQDIIKYADTQREAVNVASPTEAAPSPDIEPPKFDTLTNKGAILYPGTPETIKAGDVFYWPQFCLTYVIVRRLGRRPAWSTACFPQLRDGNGFHEGYRPKLHFDEIKYMQKVDSLRTSHLRPLESTE